jgi:hypothetical protein
MRVRVSKIAKIHKNLQEETGISASRVLEILSRVSGPGLPIAEVNRCKDNAFLKRLYGPISGIYFLYDLSGIPYLKPEL